MTSALWRERSRRGRALGAAVAVVAIIVATTAIGVSSSTHRRPRAAKAATQPQPRAAQAQPQPRAAQAATAAPAVAAQLGVFRRPQTVVDTLPQGLAHALQFAYPQGMPEVDAARRLTASDGETVYLVPTRGGVCAINVKQVFCPQAADLPGSDAADVCSPTLPSGQLELTWLIPDGGRNIAVGLADGTVRRFPSGFNAYVARFPLRASLPKAIEWDASGAHHAVGTGIPAGVRGERCTHPGDLQRR